jgi:hypothetical protein
MPSPRQSSQHTTPLLSSVRNALRVIDAFSSQEPVLGVTEIARRLNISKSAVSRLVATLCSEEILTSTPGGEVTQSNSGDSHSGPRPVASRSTTRAGAMHRSYLIVDFFDRYDVAIKSGGTLHAFNGPPLARARSSRVKILRNSMICASDWPSRSFGRLPIGGCPANATSS